MGDNKKSVTITVNGDVYRLGVGNAVGDIAPADTLAETLRERLLLTGTKISCDDGACGCCTVIMNGKAIPSCTVLTIECDGADIRTIEGLQDPNTGELDKVQQAFVDHSAFQRGDPHAGNHHDDRSAAGGKPAIRMRRRDQGSSGRKLLQMHQPLPGAGGREAGRQGRE